MNPLASPEIATSPCQACGACCAAYRVDFHASELAGGALAWEAGVPVDLAVRVAGRQMRMRGTDAAGARCAALQGVVGQQVACTIYRARPSPCREFDIHHEACARARRLHGLAPLPAA